MVDAICPTSRPRSPAVTLAIIGALQECLGSRAGDDVQCVEALPELVHASPNGLLDRRKGSPGQLQVVAVGSRSGCVQTDDGHGMGHGVVQVAGDVLALLRHGETDLMTTSRFDAGEQSLQGCRPGGVLRSHHPRPEGESDPDQCRHDPALVGGSGWAGHD